MKTIVISAVNLVEAGTLAILRDCLQYLTTLAEQEEYRVVAVVYKKELANFPNIEYIETQWPKKKWINRLWFEYVSMKRISRELYPVYLWFSLHDTSPTVIAERRVVYCHNSFPFYNWKLRELFLAPRIVMFAIFTKYFYRINIRQNSYVVVQQNWFRDTMARMFNLNREQIIVAPPASAVIKMRPLSGFRNLNGTYVFIFAASPNSHKNFECICQAVEQLEKEMGISSFKVYITIAGAENKYTKWIFRRWGNRFNSLKFIGFVNRMDLEIYYASSNCLIFPSKVETWGLPISEFAKYQKPMLLADLQYAHETAGGCKKVAFFDPDNAKQLAKLMAALIQGDESVVKPQEVKVVEAPMAHNWAELFDHLLNF
ncbi:glycosyltransferase [Mucilaginibacter lappiensis]|uniref:Glycosyltransferase involved in cell wall biosynthesis n=1 Tax=Mucilaginibacter lappiensis TaxID=354630 RepID=A0A841JHY1_9SPHI|nr:glycosyltransferase [Mucilaginibacter lappiensis]MBB6130773.1 glycosyltransferase involved in cell wall biosynthesis [Mucilaginibacter lappiensis]